MNAEQMDALLTQAERDLGQDWTRVVEWLRSQNQLDDIEFRIRLGDYDGAVSSLEEAGARFAAAQYAQYVAAATAMADWIDDKTGIPVKFDATNERAVAWARANKLDLIRSITSEQRDTIRGVIADGVRRADNPRVIANTVYDSIGLTPSQERWVASYRDALESRDYGDALSRELSHGQSDRTIAAAQAADQPLSRSQIDVAVSRYRDNVQQMRATNIARTEALRVVHQGTEEQIGQAIDFGDIPRDAVTRYWNSAHDKRTRSWHRDMDRQARAFGEAFTSGHGVDIRYPGDPDAPADETINCRCTVTTRLALGKILLFRKARMLPCADRLVLAVAA